MIKNLFDEGIKFSIHDYPGKDDIIRELDMYKMKKELEKRKN